jgi:glycosyltransferase involved in cell wall biosynthesis
MQKQNPKISVIMSAYNADRYLSEAIESILGQTYPDFEFIIIDDGSSDATQSIVLDYAERDDRIIPIINEENIGLTRSLKKGLSIAEGEFIARMDADDISLPDRFEKQVVFFQSHPEIGLLGGVYEVIDENGEDCGKSGILPQDDISIRWRLLYQNAFVHSTIMVRKTCVEQVGGYNKEFRYSQDYDLWSRVMRVTNGNNFPNALIKLRRTNQNISTMNSDDQGAAAYEIARNNINMLMGQDFLSYSQFLKIRNWQINGLGKNDNLSDVDLLKKWIAIYQGFMRKYGASENANQVKSSFEQRIFLKKKILIKIPRLFLVFPKKSIFVLITGFINIIHSRWRKIYKWCDKQILSSYCFAEQLYVKSRNALNGVIGKPKLFIYTDSRGRLVQNKYKNQTGLFPFYAYKLLENFQIEYYTCPERHTTLADFFRTYESTDKDFDIVIAHIGIVDFSPRHQSTAKSIYELKKDAYDKILPENEMKSHLESDLGVQYEGEKTINMFSLGMAKKFILPSLKEIPNLIWVGCNNFVPGWEGNYFRKRPENIRLIEKYSELFCEELPNAVNISNWNIEQIQFFTCDNIHFTSKGGKEIFCKIIETIRKMR